MAAAPTNGAALPEAAPDAPLLDIRDLSITFPGSRGILPGRRSPDVAAVVDASLQVGTSETVGLVGESGSGKPTIGKGVLRCVRPTAGAIRLGAHDVTGFGRKVPLDYRREVQVVFQDPV